MLYGVLTDVFSLNVVVGTTKNCFGECFDSEGVEGVVFDIVGGINPYGVVLVAVFIEQYVLHCHQFGIDGDAGVGHGRVAAA